MRVYLIAFLLGLTSILHTGCSSEEPQQTVEGEEIDVLPEMPETTVDVKPVSARKETAVRVRMSQGDTYYFQKTIEQSLSADPSSAITSVSEQIELLMALKVLKAMPQKYLLELRFQGVRYQSRIGDRDVTYDSRSPGIVPPEALPYKGLLNNGFVIHLSNDNRILAIQDYEEFLNQCIAEYPESMKPEMLQQLGIEDLSPQNRIASAMAFLDESIALMPFGEFGTPEDPFPIDAKWKKVLRRSRPIPLLEHLNARIEHISGDKATAHVVLQGNLRPLKPQGALTAQAVKMKVLGGSTTGSCSISLKTGLPQSCRIQRDYEIEIASLTSSPVAARKTVVTSLEAWTPPESKLGR